MNMMKKLQHRLYEKKLNTKGMTLIEVIVAVAILAIIIVPVLRVFATSSGTNLRAKMRQRATTVGESVMESFKAYNMEQLCKQFTYQTFHGVTGDSSMTMSVTADGTASGTPFHSDETLDMDATAYHFQVQNAASERHLYDITIDAIPRVNPDVYNFEDPNAYSDAIIELPENMTPNVVAKLTETANSSFETTHPISSYPGLAIDKTEITNLVRTISLDVQDVGGKQTVTESVTYTCDATISFHYAGGGPTAPPVPGTPVTLTDLEYKVKLPDDDPTGAEDYIVYDNNSTIDGVVIDTTRKCKLNNIYLFYFPNYPSSFGTGAADKIEISAELSNLYSGGGTDPIGEGLLPLNVIICKQASTLLDDHDLNSGEVNYDVTVEGTLSGGGSWKLLQNYDENLCPSGSVPAVPSISGFSDIKNIKEGVVEKTNLLYDIEIKVFEAGTTEEVATFTGTINE